ncbi:hypothetical protein AVEN_171634-1 [Araneus ventricosus]|uniref:Uncharacterized protein n=1 Tax=Araneus ventricosus TaxID=182803 RepID=A0A4Y2F1D1_ARAVE|nr:hypothetical protein AVEN_171634-1 [Araneus ventricosus]
MTAPLRIRYQTLSIPNGNIPEPSHRVWWFRREAPRSPDSTPLDFFLWGHIKGQVYATPPPTLQDLRRRITDACALRNTCYVAECAARNPVQSANVYSG